MTLRLSAVISADASQARSALAQTTAGAKQATDALTGLGAAGDGLGPKVVPPLQQLPPLMDQTARSTDGAAGAVGNLVAQFNDIGMMMAAGQNPLMLAVQQGTAITQVIGPMGAAGAIRAMGSAVVSMLSPINLVTLGVIALGATAVQWFTQAGAEAVSLSDAIGGMADQIRAFREAASDAVLPWREMLDQFGSADPALRATLEDLAGIEKIKAFETINATTASLKEMVTATSMFDDASPMQLAQRFLGFQRNSEVARASANSFLNSLTDLNSADPTLQLSGALELKAGLNQATGGYREMNAEQRQFYDGLTQIIVQLQAMGVTTDQAVDSVQRLTAAQIAGYEYYGRTRAEAAELTAEFQRQVAELDREAQIQSLIAQYGENSRQVAEARAAAERAATEETARAAGYSEAQVTALMAAYDAANGIAGAGMAGSIGAAASEAQRLAQNLGISLDVAARLAAAQARAANPDPVVFDPRDPRYDPVAAEQARILADPNRGRTQADLAAKAAKGSKGGGKTETDAVADLIDRYRAELDILRELDPVAQEMMRSRAALADATDAERQQVEELITTLHREKDAKEAVQELADATDSWFMRVANGADAAKTAIDMLLDSLLKAVIQGEGPLASLLGTKGTSLGSMIFGGGGLFGGLFGGGGGGTGTLGLPLFADGGMLYGHGGGRDDRVPVWKSPGEFTVNARATARNRALLEFINGGGEIGLPGFAAGGMIGGGTGGISATPVQQGPTFSVDARGSNDPLETERAVERGIRRALQEYSRSVLPGQLRRIDNNPLRVG